MSTKIDEEFPFPATSMPDRDWWQALWPDPLQVLQSCGIGAGMKVVDLCCGDGYFTAPICQLVSYGLCVAIDMDELLLEKTRRACGDYSNLLTLHGDARNLDRMIEGQVDFVFIANTYHGVPDKSGMAESVVKILRPEGRFAIINWHQRLKEETTVLGQPRGPKTEIRMSPAEVSKYMEPTGLKLEKVTDVGPYHYAAIYQTPT